MDPGGKYKITREAGFSILTMGLDLDPDFGIQTSLDLDFWTLENADPDTEKS